MEPELPKCLKIPKLAAFVLRFSPSPRPSPGSLLDPPNVVASCKPPKQRIFHPEGVNRGWPWVFNPRKSELHQKGWTLEGSTNRQGAVWSKRARNSMKSISFPGARDWSTPPGSFEKIGVAALSMGWKPMAIQGAPLQGEDCDEARHAAMATMSGVGNSQLPEVERRF